MVVRPRRAAPPSLGDALRTSAYPPLAARTARTVARMAAARACEFLRKSGRAGDDILGGAGVPAEHQVRYDSRERG